MQGRSRKGAAGRGSPFNSLARQLPRLLGLGAARQLALGAWLLPLSMACLLLPVSMACLLRLSMACLLRLSMACLLRLRVALCKACLQAPRKP